MRWVGAGVLVVIAVAVVVATPPVTGPAAAWSVGMLALGAATLAAAAAVGRVAGGAAVGGAAAALGIALLVSAALSAAGDAPGAPSPWSTALDQRVLFAILLVGVPVLVLLVPNGRLDATTDRGAAALAVLAGTAAVIAPVPVVAVPAVTVVVIALVGAVAVRFDRARDLDRERILWVLHGGGTAAVVGGHLLFAAEAAGEGPGRVALLTVAVLAGMLLPAMLVLAVRAPRAIDVRRTIAGTVLAVIMVDLVLGGFVGALAALELASGRPPSRSAAAMVALVVAVGFRPALVRVREALDQVLFGGRPDPVGVVSSLGAELRRGGGPQQWLDALRDAVGVPSAELRTADGLLAVSGSPAGPVTSVALHAGDERIGELVVGLLEHHRELPRATEHVLRLVAAPLARALQSARLAEELQRSRHEVVVAAEEERRRVRRDLHDGLGPVLAGVAYTADAARNVVDRHPEHAATLLADLREDVAGAVAEVRRIVHDLRPPALDQLGLVPAIRQQGGRLRSRTGDPLDLVVEADELPDLPAATEVAAYRLVVEALHNVARHTDATRAVVTVAVDGRDLDLRVTDDAPAPGVPWVPGVGLTSMRERVEQLGGRLRAGPSGAGGEVHASLPLADVPAPSPSP